MHMNVALGRFVLDDDDEGEEDDEKNEDDDVDDSPPATSSPPSPFQTLLEQSSADASIR